MAYEVIMGLSASYAIVFVGTFTEYPNNSIMTNALRYEAFNANS